MPDSSEQGRRCGLRFDLSWDTDHGYRVSRPQLLNHGERIEVLPVSEHELVVQELRHAAEELRRVLAPKTLEPEVRLALQALGSVLDGATQ